MTTGAKPGELGPRGPEASGENAGLQAGGADEDRDAARHGVARRLDDTYLATCHPAFLKHGLDELRLLDPALVVGSYLAEGVALIRTSLTGAEFVTRLLADEPVFVRHVAPAQVAVDLSGAWADLDVLPAALQLCKPLSPERSFAVQCRKGPGPKLEYGSRDVEVRVGSAVEASGVRVDLAVPEQAISVFLASGKAYVGVSPAAANLSRQADEHRLFSREEEHVCRAEFKLREALAKFEVSLAPGERALDVGAAPGGWTRVLARLGLEVVAVDPAELSPDLYLLPNVAHLKARAEEAQLDDASFDLLVNDMNVAAPESATILCRLAHALKPGSPAIMTAKLTNRRVEETLRQTREILRSEFEVARAKHMVHNRLEVTLLLRRKPA